VPEWAEARPRWSACRIGRQLAVEALDVAGELGEAEVAKHGTAGAGGRRSPAPADRAAGLGELRRPDDDGVGLVDPSDDVLLTRDVDPHEAHGAPLRRGQPGASEPVLTLRLVHARTPGAAQDTVRVLSTGRGRHSHCRGRGLKRSAATLSRIPGVSQTSCARVRELFALHWLTTRRPPHPLRQGRQAGAPSSTTPSSPTALAPLPRPQ